MIARAKDAVDRLASLWAQERVDFARFMRGQSFDDNALADLIEVDARALIERGEEVSLTRYLDAVPHLADLPIALDAAIEFALRSRSGAGRPTQAAIDALINAHPHLEHAIRSAAALSEGLATTRTIRRLNSFVGARGPTSRTSRELPADFGPLMDKGRARYQLTSLLGSGCQGEVYLAIDRPMSEPDRPAMVALKILSTIGLTESQRWLAQDEGRRARRVTHQNVVRVLDRGTTAEGSEYIVYEYVEGGDFDNFLRTRQTDARTIAGMVAAMARGVQAAHDAGLVHRDLKPSNVLLTSSGEPKIADFGTAALSSSGADVGDGDGDRVGNLAFIAPEQYRGGEGAHSGQADVYALGGILYFGLTGDFPHGGSQASVHRAFSTQQAPSAESKDRIAARLAHVADADLASIVHRALDPDVKVRYRTADALANDLDAWLNHQPLTWNSPSLIHRIRLSYRRAPRQIVAIAASIAAVLAATAGIAWTTAVSRERIRHVEIDRTTAQAFANATERQQREMESRLEVIQATLINDKKLEPDDWLPMVSIFESMLGPQYFTDSSLERRLWQDRASAMAWTIQRAERAAGGMTLQTMLWRDTTVYWLIRNNRPDSALTLLSKTDAAWDRTLKPDDPWRAFRIGLRCMATIKRFQLQNPGTAAASADVELALAAAGLRTFERSVSITHPGTQLHRFTVEMLKVAYGEKFLNQPDDWTWAKRRLGQLTIDEREELYHKDEQYIRAWHYLFDPDHTLRRDEKR